MRPTLHLNLLEIKRADSERGELNKNSVIQQIKIFENPRANENFQCQEVDYKTIELKVKEVLQKEPSADLSLLVQDKIHLLLK